MDFRLTTYEKLLHNLSDNGYSFQTLQDFIQQPENSTIIHHHDVDKLPINAFRMANLMENGGRP